MTDRKFIPFPETGGLISDLDPKILEDVKLSIQAYFSGEANIENGWDTDRFCKVMKDEESGHIMFLKLVGAQDNKKVAALHLDKSMVDEWMNE